MIETIKNYKEYLDALTKNNLIIIVKNYHIICDIYNIDKGQNIEKKKKKDIIDYIVDNLETYLRHFVMLFDLSDFELLKEIIKNNKKLTDSFLVDNRNFINNLLDNMFIFQKENLELPLDIFELLKVIINDKNILKEIRKNNNIYLLGSGIVIAYGVIDIDYFNEIVNNIDEKSLLKLNYYYKKNYLIDNKKVISTKLSNKQKINKYLKDKNYKLFKNREFLELGKTQYHHNIKSYKKLIKILKNNYVFKNNDIMYIDEFIVIPYLYNSLNEEEVAKKELIATVEKLFEFKGEKLKNKMLEEILKIRNDFPIWEYRGYTKNEVK